MDNHEETASRLFLSVAQSRNVDQFAIDHLGIHSLVLMENAGRGAAEIILTQLLGLLREAPDLEPMITLLIGPGNNGGDGWVIARHLENWGAKVVCFLFGEEDRLSPDNLANYRIWIKSGGKVTRWISLPRIIALDLLRNQLARSPIVVDALLGTGSTGAPREPMADAIRLANQTQRANNTDIYRIAIDLPSGLNADSGLASAPTFCAHLTLTMVTQKIGFKNPEARRYLGEVRVLPIGIPASQLRGLTEL